MNLNFLLALLNVITCAGIIILVEATAMSGGKKQMIGIVLIILGVVVGALTGGMIVFK